MKSAVEACILRARERESAGDVREAAEVLRSGLLVDPNEYVLHLELGRLSLELEEYESALAALQHCLSAGPATAAVHSCIGQALDALGRTSEAIAAFTTSIQLAPRASRYVLLGTSLLHAGREDEAVSAFRTALLLEADNAEALRSLARSLRVIDPCEAVLLLSRVLAGNPEDSAAQRELGFALAAQGQHERALSVLTPLLDMRPSDPWTFIYVAQVLRDTGGMTEAEEHLQRAVRIAPEASFTHQFLGAFYQEEGRHSEAAESLGVAFDLAPDNPDVAVRYRRGQESPETGLRECRTPSAPPRSNPSST